LHVFGALSEFERELVRTRARAGLEAARARGRLGGRPRMMTPQKVETARKMYESGDYPVDVIAKAVGVSRASIYRYLAPSASEGALPQAQTKPNPAGLRRTPSSASLSRGSRRNGSGVGGDA
jgi:DNA invertase Pin-like site-specific DNA recombinase